MGTKDLKAGIIANLAFKFGDGIIDETKDNFLDREELNQVLNKHGKAMGESNVAAIKTEMAHTDKDKVTKDELKEILSKMIEEGKMTSNEPSAALPTELMANNTASAKDTGAVLG